MVTSSLFITIDAKCDSSFANEILSSLHLSLFSFTLLSEDHFATLSAIFRKKRGVMHNNSTFNRL